MSDVQVIKRVLVAGCGDVGTGVALRFAEDGAQVTGLRRDPSRLPQPIAGYAGDLANPESLTGLSQQVFDLVIVAASAGGFSAEAYQRVYVNGLSNLLDVLQGTPSLLLVSSTGVYHQHDGEWVDEHSPTCPQGFSGLALLAAEQLLSNRAPGAFSILRAAGIYGPGRERLLNEVRAGRGVAATPVRYGNRIHREDCIGALYFLGSRLLSGQAVDPVYIGVDSDPAPAHEVRRWLADKLGVELTEIINDSPVMRGANKRCRNARLLQAGYRFFFPTYREGYTDIIASTSTAAPRGSADT